jgi:hypothetical protein
MINKDFLEGLLARLKIFWTTMILVFFVVGLQYLGVHVPSMLPMVTKLQTFFHPSHEISYSLLNTHAQTLKKEVNKHD